MATGNDKEESAERSSEMALSEEQTNLSLEPVWFDEMNLVELPFSLLTRNTDGIYEIPLSSDGRNKLACLNSSEYGLPNSLAPTKNDVTICKPIVSRATGAAKAA